MWRVGRVDAPLGFPPAAHLPDPRTGRFDDPLGRYRTLYCARHQTTALRESLQHFRYRTETLVALTAAFGVDGVPRALVPTDWRAKRLLAPAKIRLAAGALLIDYEEPELLRSLERVFASHLEAHGVASLDIPALRSKDRVVSQLLGRALYEQGHAGIVFESALPPGGTCMALFEGRAWLDADGPPLKLSESLPSLRTVCNEMALELS